METDERDDPMETDEPSVGDDPMDTNKKRRAGDDAMDNKKKPRVGDNPMPTDKPNVRDYPMDNEDLMDTDEKPSDSDNNMMDTDEKAYYAVEDQQVQVVTADDNGPLSESTTE
ncbi:hypothetical protein V6N13_097826 [Hibiscus sabdariffa]|uniref:Uncharacterized protein n=1 Tax=Hibiscus sabdariffa TaxID=183260 RepID=A0ABR2CCI9_9ROSI